MYMFVFLSKSHLFIILIMVIDAANGYSHCLVKAIRSFIGQFLQRKRKLHNTQTRFFFFLILTMFANKLVLVIWSTARDKVKSD